MSKYIEEFLESNIKDFVEQLNRDKPQYPSDMAAEWADSSTPIYNSDIITLYSTDTNGIIDDAFDEAISEGMVDSVKSIVESIRLGIYWALYNALSNAASEWEVKEEEEEEEEGV